MQLNSVQRNYDVISKMMQTKAKEAEAVRGVGAWSSHSAWPCASSCPPPLFMPSAQLQATLELECARRVGIAVQLEEATRRAEAAEAQVAKLRGLPDQLAAAHAELQKLRFDSSLANGRSSTLEERCRTLI